MNKDDKVIEELIGQLEHQKDLTQEYKDACNKHMTKIMELTVEIGRLKYDGDTMRIVELTQERDALRDRVRELEIDLKHVQRRAEANTVCVCGNHKQRDYRDRLDRMVAAVVTSDHGLTFTLSEYEENKLALQTKVVRLAVSYLAAIDAHVEGK